ncbi:hypothetical protein BaRGS_00035032 [Batillaria attramentaria]|uniref:GDP-fucose protein O-fucosyltransferase 1 n=1 Tax=Batillaria attramentaria TaxID=370345 RepID=A0ABD0JFK3_9CAEN
MADQGFRRLLVCGAVVLVTCMGVCHSDNKDDRKSDPQLPEVDLNGYIVYCPCMGRFGNQADQFLGTLGFAHALNRTLVLPAWVQYHRHQIQSVQVPFDTYFKVEPLREYHRVVTMEDFMKTIAPIVWPEEHRIAFCHSPRRSTTGETDKKSDCHAKDGNPFKSFWDTYNVDFVGSQFYSPLYFGTQSPHEMRAWRERYSPDDYPVLAFVGPPAAFPVQEHHVKLHKYLKWSDKYETKAADFINDNIPDKPFLGIHLRNGMDFKNACEHMKSTANIFSIAQCVGYRNEFGPATYDMCFPADKLVIKQVKAEVKRIGAKAVFVATDNDDMITAFSKQMKTVKFVRQPHPADPMLDLAILGQADHFIGNCVSSFTAFVKRERDTTNKSSSFWAFTRKREKEEL